MRLLETEFIRLPGIFFLLPGYLISKRAVVRAVVRRVGPGVVRRRRVRGSVKVRHRAGRGCAREERAGRAEPIATPVAAGPSADPGTLRQRREAPAATRASALRSLADLAGTSRRPLRAKARLGSPATVVPPAPAAMQRRRLRGGRGWALAPHRQRSEALTSSTSTGWRSHGRRRHSRPAHTPSRRKARRSTRSSSRATRRRRTGRLEMNPLFTSTDGRFRSFDVIFPGST